MAYLDLDYPPACGGNAATATSEATFTPLEERVIAIALGDPAASVRTPGKFAQVLDAVFGMRMRNQLADARLETLRRYVVTSRSRAGIRDVDRHSLFEAGLHKVQMDTLDLRLGINFMPAEAPDRPTVGVAKLGDIATRFWLRSQLSESFVVAMLVAYFGLPLAVSPKPWR